MSWYEKIWKRESEPEGMRLLRLRSVRFRHLLISYGKILDLIAESAERQGNDYMLDLDYVRSLVEVLLDRADSIVFDLNVMSGQGRLDFYDLLEKPAAAVREIMAEAEIPAADREDRALDDGHSDAGHGPALQEASPRPVLYDRSGQVASRGVGAGPVFRLEGAGGDDFPKGAVLAAADMTAGADIIRAMRKASAVLTDSGRPADHMAALARQFKIPAIVGLGDVTARLDSGMVVTVDADANVVYQGRVQELLDRRAAERGRGEDEVLNALRRLRRAAFPLTISSDDRPEGIPATLHDVVHQAHELAGDVMAELYFERRDLKRALKKIDAGDFAQVMVIDLGDGLSGREQSPPPRMDDILCVPLRAFLSGFAPSCYETVMPEGASPATVTAAVREEHANMVRGNPQGFDMVDSLICDSRESNYIYCRFASSSGPGPESGGRGRAAREILARLGFGAVLTRRAAGAWISGLPRADVEHRVRVAGKLLGFLLCMDANGWRMQEVEQVVEAFMKEHA